MEDRPDQPELRAAQYAVAGIAVAFLLAGIAGFFVNTGIAIACFIAATLIFVACEKFELIQRLRLQWPPSLTDFPIHSPWAVFRGIMYSGVAIALIFSLVLGETFYIFDLRTRLQNAPPMQNGRHLTEDQKARIREALRLSPNENYYVDFNSVPACDECEDFAEELREFVAAIPGWKTGGGPIFFWDNGPWLVGLELACREDEKDSPAPTKLRKAFDSASLPLASRYFNMAKGTTIILIGRQPKQ